MAKGQPDKDMEDHLIWMPHSAEELKENIEALNRGFYQFELVLASPYGKCLKF